MIKKTVFLGFLLLSFLEIFAQKPLEYYKQKYPDDGEVILSQTQVMKISVEKNKLKITADNFEESYIINDDAFKRRSVGSVMFSTFREINDLEAYTWIPNSSNRFKKVEAINFRLVPNKYSRTFHDDTKIKEFDYPQLASGTKKTLKYTINYPEPRLISGEVFMDNSPVEYKEFTVITDKNVDLGYKVFNDKQKVIQFEKTEKDGKLIYKWSSNNVKKYNFEEKMPNYMYHTPMVEVYVKSFTDGNGKKNEILNSIENLHQHYETYIKDVEEAPSEELKKTALALKAKHAEEIEQVKEIYYWVKNNIKYIAFEDGYGGFIPRKANDVFTKRYGDCKDMSVIIYTMMKSAGISNTYLTWIGSREKPFKYEDIPTQLVDDHMIVCYQKDGKNIFLDATSKHTPFGYPSSFIQGKQALVHKSKGAYQLVDVPVVEPEKSAKKDDIVLQLVDKKLIGKAKTIYTGFERDNFLHEMEDHSGFQKTSFLKEKLELGNNKFFLEKHEIKNQEDRDQNLEITYDFTLDNYAISAGNEVYVNLALDKLKNIKTLETKREFAYEADNTFLLDSTVKLMLPKDYKISYVPEDSSFQNPQFSYKIQYQKNADSIEMKMQVKLNYLLLPPSEVSQWNAFVNQLQEKMSESVGLQKK